MTNYDKGPSPHPALEQGVKDHQSGRLAEAEKAYRLVLEDDPGNADALHLLGVLEQQSGNPENAIGLIEKAIRIAPSKAMIHFNLGVSMLALDRLDEAAAAYQMAIQLRPDWPEAHEALAVVHQNRGLYELAADDLHEALRLHPDSSVALRLLGDNLRKLDKLPESEAAFRRALAIASTDAEAHFGLGITLRRQGRLADAESSFRSAVASRHDFTDAHINLGNILIELGRPSDAENAYRRALVLNADDRRALVGMGTTLQALGRNVESLQIFNSMESPECDDPAIYRGKALALQNLKRFEEAEGALRRALSIRPDDLPSKVRLNALLIELGRLAEAETIGRAAVSSHPQSASAWIALGDASHVSGHVVEAVDCFRRALQASPDDANVISIYLFTLNYLPGLSFADLLAEHRKLSGIFSGVRKQLPFTKDRIDDIRGRKLRIGYVSADFRAHPVASFILPVLRHHDAGRFEIHCYYNDHRVVPMTERLMRLALHWRPIFALNDDAVAEMIARDKIDILVDLSGHTAGNRLKVFGRRAAPVQVTWMGSPSMTGLAEMDYWLTDRHVFSDLVKMETGSERPFHLPDSHVCYQPPSDLACAPATPAAMTGHVTFGVFCKLIKAADTSFDLWAGVLSRMPEARLLMVGGGVNACRESIAGRFAARGIAPERIELKDRVNTERYLELHGSIDILLDSYPYAGGSTNFNALWMGVPVISLAGELPASRCGSIAQSVLGLEDLIASTPHEYIERAVQLAGNLNRLNELRTTLRERMSRSVLVDGKTFTRNLEAAYMEMWHARCDSREI